MKNAGSGWRNTKDQESMQQLVQLETARSEHGRGERQIQNTIDLRKDLWACETKQPHKPLFSLKPLDTKPGKKRTVLLLVHFFLLFYHVSFLHNVPHKINSLLASAWKRDQLKRDHIGYLATKKRFYVRNIAFLEHACEQSSPVTCAHEEFHFPMQERTYPHQS